MCAHRQTHPADTSAPDDPVLRNTTAGLPGTAILVRLDGEVDQEERHRLEGALAGALDDGPPLLVVDLSRLVLCDSTGRNVLLETRLDARTIGTELVLAAPLPQPRRLLEVTGTAEVLTIRDTLRAALSGDRCPPAG
ncbi:STAS domain-containing protein [Kitasatospora sp. NPDC001309]|uniref:STAS domain-containing protein n=1 Tax=unclassified Kitasatospora TaxID=2633591 RepID=UPI0036B82EA2